MFNYKQKIKITIFITFYLYSFNLFATNYVKLINNKYEEHLFTLKCGLPCGVGGAAIGAAGYLGNSAVNGNFTWTGLGTATGVGALTGATLGVGGPLGACMGI